MKIFEIISGVIQLLSEFIPVILMQNQPLDHKLFTRLSPYLIYLFVSMPQCLAQYRCPVRIC